ncbi:MAG: hypothetical protein ABJC39_10285 [Chloroflexota bacterium]
MSFSIDVRRRRVRELAPRLFLAVSFAIGLWYGLTNAYAAVQFVPYAGVGIFLILRRPRNVIGWTLLGLGWSFLVVVTPNDLDLAALQAKSAGPFLEAMTWLGGWAGSAAYALFFLLAVVFPSGRIPGGAWGRFIRIALVADGVLIVLGAFQPAVGVALAGERSVDVPNPLALFPEAPIWAISRGGLLIFPVMVLAFVGVVSSLIRYRRARGLERQQLRWLVSSFAFVGVAVPVGLATMELLGPDAATLGWMPAQVAFFMVPISIGVAVMRYRLYEIDRIISRTLAYTALTAALAVVYVAAFVALQAILIQLAGNGGPVPVAASTLAVAALFQPLRRRIQHGVDRRFHRARYDAEATAAAFARMVRDEVDPIAVEAALLSAVESVVRPQVASVWLREAPR